MQVGAFSATIPAGSFAPNKKGRFIFHGVINGVTLQVQIAQLGENNFVLKVDGNGINLTSLMNPINVGLTIGDDTGTTTVAADFI